MLEISRWSSFWGLVSTKKYFREAGNLIGELREAESRVRDLETFSERSRTEVSEVRKAKQGFENKLRDCFWALAKADAMIKTDYGSSGGQTYYRYRVYFRPQLARSPSGCGTWGEPYRGCNEAAVAREKAILERLMREIGVKDWGYDEPYLVRTYPCPFCVENLLNAPKDIDIAVKVLQEHLNQMLKEQIYHEVLNPDKERVV